MWQGLNTFAQISSSQMAQHAAPSSGLTGTQQQDHEPKDSNFLEPPLLSGREFHYYNFHTPHCCNKKPTSRHVIAGHEEVLNDIIG